MEALTFHNKLISMNDKDYIENLLIYQASLVIAGVKPATTFTISLKNERLNNLWNKYGINFLNSVPLDYYELVSTDNLRVVIIYNEKSLLKNLSNTMTHNFLVNLGYPKDLNIKPYLNILKKRYLIYTCPHELGVFLGIPLDDVKDFINCSEKKCLLCGYWKVYNNLHRASALFQKYDIIKTFAINSILNETLSKDIVIKIRNSFDTQT